MKQKEFRPNLGKDCERSEIIFPLFGSKKLDGIRCIFHPVLGMVSRSLKQIKNKQLQEKFSHLVKLSKDLDVIFDGELYLENMSFQNITSLVMTEDFMNEKTFKKIHDGVTEQEKYYGIDDSRNLLKTYYKYKDGVWDGIPSNFINPIEFHCFDCLDNDNHPFESRIAEAKMYLDNIEHTTVVDNILIENNEQLDKMFDKIVSEGGEGVILRNRDSCYKFGRSTIKEQGLLKVKPFETFDTKILGLFERLENTNKSFKNELGQSTKRNTKEDKKPTGIAAGFFVEYRGVSLKVTLTGTEEFRREIWTNREKYVGRMIEYKGMLVGSKDCPRHPVFLRFRGDRD